MVDEANAAEWESPSSMVHLVSLSWLKPHEEIRAKNAKKLEKMTKRWGGYTKPLLVDKNTGAILDGHHRHAVGQKLGLARLPVMLFDYLEDERIIVEVWPNCGIESLSKQDIIKMCLSENVYPPKTSRHLLTCDVPPILVPLEILSQES
jgi:hypothetical protein